MGTYVKKRFRTSVAFRLQKAMDAKRFDGICLSECSGVSVSSISGYLNSHSVPTRRTASRLAEALGVEVDWLLGVTPFDQSDSCGSMDSPESVSSLYAKLSEKNKELLVQIAVLLVKSQNDNLV